jgi:polyisoprenoid-binding protein YceI
MHGTDKCEYLVLADRSTATENWSPRGNERGLLSTRIRYVLASTACLMAFLASPRASYAQVPTYEVTPAESSINFGVESSVSIKGIFEKWNASIKFSSRDVRSAVLEIQIEADSVNTGSHMKDNKLKGKDFFNVKESPLITFQSTKIVQTGPNTFDVEGNFTIRGVTKTERLTLTSEGKGTPSGGLDGTMAFDRKDYGMNSNIPFIKIANRVEVNVRLKWRRVSGPPPVFQQ